MLHSSGKGAETSKPLSGLFTGYLKQAPIAVIKADTAVIAATITPAMLAAIFVLGGSQAISSLLFVTFSLYLKKKLMR